MGSAASNTCPRSIECRPGPRSRFSASGNYSRTMKSMRQLTAIIEREEDDEARRYRAVLHESDSEHNAAGSATRADRRSGVQNEITLRWE